MARGRNEAEMKDDVYYMAYTILRRLIRKHRAGSESDLEHLFKVSQELEAKTLEEMEVIHKRELGY